MPKTRMTSIANEAFDFTEEMILAKAPELVGVFGLFRHDPLTNIEEAVLIGSGILRQILFMAFRTGAAPRANRFRFEVCSVGPQMAELTGLLQRKMANTCWRKSKLVGKTIGSGGQSHVELVEDITGKKPGLHALKLLKSAKDSQARER